MACLSGAADRSRRGSLGADFNLTPSLATDTTTSLRLFSAWPCACLPLSSFLFSHFSSLLPFWLEVALRQLPASKASPFPWLSSPGLGTQGTFLQRCVVGALVIFFGPGLSGPLVLPVRGLSCQMRGHPQMAARGGATRQELLELLKSVLPNKSWSQWLRYHETAQHTFLLAQGRRS